MAGSKRVLAVTTNPSLVIGLTFANHGYEVDSTPELIGGTDADVVVLDVAADAVMRQLEQLGPQRPPVVVVSAEPPGGLPTDVVVAPRPFTLDHLTAAIDQVLLPVGEPEMEAPAVAPVGQEQGIDDLPGAPGEEGDLPAADADSARTGLLGRFGEVPSGPPTEDRLQPDSAAGAQAPSSEEPSTEPVSPETIIDLTGATPHDLPEVDDREGGSSPPADTPAPDTVAPEPISVPAPAASRPGPTASTAPRRARWFARQRREPSGPDRDLRTRLAHVLTAASELEALTQELPLLRSQHALARAVVVEIGTAFQADSAALWSQEAQGEWSLIAQEGFTAHERRGRVPADQPLFSELERTGGGLLVDPIDSLQAAVAGIPGAHTRSFMAAAVGLGGARLGIVAVGRGDRLVADDLDRLLELCSEAAPGLAVAQQLARFAALVDTHAPGLTDAAGR